MKNKPYNYTLHVDWDYPWPKHWIPFWKNTITTMLADLDLMIKTIIIKPSPSKKGGSHIWIQIASTIELTDDMVNMLQFLCGDDHTRVWINTLRIDRGLKKYWSKLFVRHLYKKPLPKKCQKCRLREILNEMREQYELQAAEKQKS